MNPLQKLSQMLAAAPRGSTQALMPSDAALDLYSGHECRTPADRYHWDGQRRGDANEPVLLLQYTLDGFGIYEDEQRRLKVVATQAFTAILPSRHLYYLPAESSSWTFFWVMVRHPYIVQRISKSIDAFGPIVAAAPASEFVTRLTELFISARTGAENRFTRERQLFDLLTAYDRAVHAMQHAPDQREALLNTIHARLHGESLARLRVNDLATKFGMSRSNFSHHFRHVTGLAPAAYLLGLRLARARDLLMDGTDSVKAIARATGFANSNHFAKAFRRRFGFTPGAFRAQLRV